VHRVGALYIKIKKEGIKMGNDYWISVWAKLRQDEVIRIPQDYTVHADFTHDSDDSEIKAVFKQINTLYTTIYGDIAVQPEDFGMPLHLKEQYRVFSQQWRDSGQAPYRPFALLYNLFICGDIVDGAVKVSFSRFKNVNKIKQTHFLFNKLADYGFAFEGLKNNKLANNDIIVSYPDNNILLLLLKSLADKAHNTNRLDDFLCCHFRLLQNDMNTADYGYGADDVADRVHTEAEKEFIYKMDETLMSMGLFRKPYGGFECHGLAYYHSETIMNAKGPYTFRMVSRNTDIENNIYDSEKMLFMLRIRNVSKCLDYLTACPESVKEIV
jgi:hypothetical protein